MIVCKGLIGAGLGCPVGGKKSGYYHRLMHRKVGGGTVRRNGLLPHVLESGVMA